METVMINKNLLIVEFLGTFFFLSVILHSFDDSRIGAFGISAALLTAIYLGGSLSGGHYNPAVTVAMFLDNKLTLSVALLYIVVQLCGAYGAYIFNNHVLKNKI